MTLFSHMRISMDVNNTASSMESVLNVGLYFEKMASYSQCHVKTCLYLYLYLPDTPNTSRRVLRGVRAKMALILVQIIRI